MVGLLSLVVQAPICEQGIEITDVQECRLRFVVFSRLACRIIINPLSHHLCVEGQEGICFWVLL